MISPKLLTTAATILMVAAVGITIGERMFSVASMTTALIIVVLMLLRRVERANPPAAIVSLSAENH
jgi:uncharacterized membrane protein YhiD involved in acid resistance